ncbi:hypothetical protein N9N67_06655 [Bacteriovoracaceae bacterium]|nr:hypothetical protein [Bacteriovoracaceae bacterium]
MKLFIFFIISVTLNAFSQQTLPKYDEEFNIKELKLKKLYFDTLRIKVNEAFSEVCRNTELSANWLLAEYFLDFENHQVSKLYFFPEGQPVFVLRTFKLDEDIVSLIDFDFYTNEEATFIEKILVNEYEKIGQDVVENNMKDPRIIKENAYRNLTQSPCLPVIKPKLEKKLENNSKNNSKKI